MTDKTQNVLIAKPSGLIKYKFSKKALDYLD